MKNTDKTIRILIADDHAVIRDGLSMILGLQDDLTVIGQAQDGLEAVELCRRLTPDIVIMDLMMPKLDGIKTLMKLRESRNIPVILLSAKSEDTDKIFGLTAGADDYVTKPFDVLHRVHQNPPCRKRRRIGCDREECFPRGTSFRDPLCS